MLEKTSIVLLCLMLSGCADKVAHAAVGAALYPVDNSCKLSLALGVGKELVDMLTHKPELLDIAFTFIGCKIFQQVTAGAH